MSLDFISAQNIHDFIYARQQLATLYLGDFSSFPLNQDMINAPGIFKADHLRSLVAIIEIFHVQKKIQQAAPNNQFLNDPNHRDIQYILSRYCSIPHLQERHLVFTDGQYALDPAQQYKIARACFDRELIDEENFHAILRRIHAKIKNSNTKDDQQLRRNVKFYLAETALRLYYKVGQTAQKKEIYRGDLTNIYNDLIGSKKALYRDAIAKGKPKALSARAMINQFMSNGSQKVPYSDPLTHGVEVTTPFMNAFGKAFYIPLMILGFIIDLVPRIIMSGGTLLLQALAIPFALVIGLFWCCCCRTPSRGGDFEGWLYLLLPLMLLALIFKPWFSSSDSVGLWGQRIENRWLDTGFTFILGKVGSFLGNVVGWVIGVAISIALYLPRLIVQGLR